MRMTASNVLVKSQGKSQTPYRKGAKDAKFTQRKTKDRLIPNPTWHCFSLRSFRLCAFAVDFGLQAPGLA
jgi:hypothetical protein